MAAVVNTGMDKQDMKRLLMRSKSEPVNCAIGTGSDASVGLLLLDKVKGPKAVEKELLSQIPEAKNTRFGTAFVDTDLDPKTVRIQVNKPVSGMSRKLVKTLKGTGFTKVKIVLEDGSAVEEADDEQDGAAIQPPSAPVAAEAPATAAAPAQPDQPSGQDANAQPAAEGPSGPDAAALLRTLTDLVRRVVPAISADPARGDELKALATQAQAALKQGDLNAASSRIDSLRDALDGAATPAAASGTAANQPAPADPAAAKAIDKSRLAWVMTRKKVEGEVEKLHDAISAAYKDHGAAEQLEQAFQSGVEKMLDALDHSLTAKLEDVNNAAPADRGKLVGEAQRIISRYQSYLDSEPLIAKLDSNPFVPVAVHKTLSASLAALAKSVR